MGADNGDDDHQGGREINASEQEFAEVKMYCTDS
jgi:hypothetical protein